MQVFDIGDGIHDAAEAQDVGIFCEQGWGYDAGLVLSGLEVRVGEEEEEGGEGVFGKIVWKELHGICTDDRDVLERRRGRGVVRLVCDAQSRDAILDVLGHLDADLHA